MRIEDEQRQAPPLPAIAHRRGIPGGIRQCPDPRSASLVPARARTRIKTTAGNVRSDRIGFAGDVIASFMLFLVSKWLCGRTVSASDCKSSGRFEEALVRCGFGFLTRHIPKMPERRVRDVCCRNLIPSSIVGEIYVNSDHAQLEDEDGTGERL
jgi:hypothetical protein